MVYGKKSLLDKSEEKETKEPVAKSNIPTAKLTQIMQPAKPTKIKIEEMDDFSADLIKQINKEAGGRKAFNLGVDEAPTNVKRWVSSGSVQMDYILSNKSIGGFPEGRIIEIQGPTSIGKSTLAALACRSVQLSNGIAVYIDTENATSLENLQNIGVNVHKRFVFIQETCIEEIFKIIESTIDKARSLKNDIPVLVVWDSIAASTPKDELDGEYDKNTIGLAARVLSKGFRKITHVIGDKNVTLLLINQQRTKIGTLYGDPMCVSPSTKIRIRKSVPLSEIKSPIQKIENKHFEEEVTLKQLFQRFEIVDLADPQVIDISDSGYKVESWDEKIQQKVWKPIEALVVKEKVEKHFQLSNLHGTSTHRVFNKTKYIELQNHPEAVLINEPMEVVDMMVQDTENYIAEGFVNHNTTSGGMAIPYHASIRIKLTGGQQIKKTVDGREAVIGIFATAKTIKNKVARPWREVDFEIHFGRGIKEDEQIFDALKLYLEKADNKVLVDGKHVSVGGGGGWKEFLVTDAATGEEIESVKFYKTDFAQKILNEPKYKKYTKALLDACYIMNPETDDHITYAGVDMESVDEVRQLDINSTQSN